jgi:hypothetical protein
MMIDEWLQEMELITTELVNQLDHVSYEELSGFLNQREQLIDRYKQMDMTEKEREPYSKRVLHLLDFDQLIAVKINQFKNQANDEIKKLLMAQQQKNAYDMGNLYSDSMFFDKKK